MLKQALKEWDVAVNALTAGETILLMRKGGIREARGQFDVAVKSVLLYPTYEHQKSALLKPAYAHQVQPVASGWHPTQVTLRSFAQITDIFYLTAAATVDALQAFHVWNHDFVHERLHWQPQRPLSIICLRVFALPEPQIIPYHAKYGGCRSWIELNQSVDIADATAVISDVEYAARVAQIRAICQS
ncbi:DUF1802 family protein [filamentous cyanobacterium LEGE 11480]|uniref:DUF1802 family protein n=1 Tax=Romeriopsis navalis LEGE 11480 TaxID=2777977 RepID=A0A928VPN9_9CYAN|nr:DUF1802 family protein [Romeriopsis navalis]MBE9030247.1 DUF1802 family protein [Romeriopsis navalis LEGE 11480]